MSDTTRWTADRSPLDSYNTPPTSGGYNPVFGNSGGFSSLEDDESGSFEVLSSDYDPNVPYTNPAGSTGPIGYTSVHIPGSDDTPVIPPAEPFVINTSFGTTATAAPLDYTAGNQADSGSAATDPIPVASVRREAQPSQAARAAQASRNVQAARSSTPGKSSANAGHSRPSHTQASQTPPDRPGQPKKRRRKNKLLLGLLALIGILLVAAVLLLVLMTTTLKPYENYNVIMPNVYVSGIDVGGMTQQEALAALSDKIHPSEPVSISVNLPDRTLDFAMSSEDITLDLDSAVNAAWRYGRGSGMMSAWETYQAVKKAQRTRKDIDVTESTHLDTDAIRATIDEAAGQINTEMIPSTVSADVEAGIITVTIGIPGVHLDADGLYDAVCSAFALGMDAILNYEYEYTYPDEVSVDDYYEDMTIDPVNASYDPATATVTPGSVGCAPTTSLADAQQQLASAGYGTTLTFTFAEVQPEVQAAELEALLFRDVIASYGSVFDGSNSGRTTNLRLACQAINGTVVLPGETFSFNSTVGERTADKGYQKATVYVSGNSVPQLGGGVCQVASTIYYCCMYADLEIVEREPHMYFVTYVPGGLDATVYWGQVDYKFRNDTDYPIRIEAWLEGGKCWIKMIGTDDGNTAEITSTCTATNPFTTINKDGTGENVSGYTGYTYQITRYIYDSNGNLIRTDTPSSLGSLGTSVYNRRDKIVYSGKTPTSPSPSPSPSATPEPSTAPEPSVEPAAPPEGATELG